MPQIWLITGSSRGLGRAFTEAALRAGNHVAATARRIESLQSLKEEFGDRVLPLELDVTDERQASYVVRTAIDAFGGLDVLVNNAGYANVAPIEETPLQDFRKQIETNLFGVIVVTKAVLPYFRERRAGKIFQISSIGGRIGPIGRAPYAAAKFGVEGFSESLAREVGTLGIHVTIVEPGGFRTDFAGSSTTLRSGGPDYDATVGQVVRFQRNFDGKQPGDPAKAASVLLELALSDEPPLRILLGSDAYGAAEKNDEARLALTRQFKTLSLSTDFS
jgi:NAD(P)-dependent dehydrogenase (short-subunit alcohol dehydrogenase family)